MFSTFYFLTSFLLIQNELVFFLIFSIPNEQIIEYLDNKLKKNNYTGYINRISGITAKYL